MESNIPLVPKHIKGTAYDNPALWTADASRKAIIAYRMSLTYGKQTSQLESWINQRIKLYSDWLMVLEGMMEIDEFNNKYKI